VCVFCCGTLFCHAFAFSTNLTFVLLRSLPLLPLPLGQPNLPVYVLEFFLLLLAFHQSHSLFHISVCVCVTARGYWWVGCATHFLTFRWGKCVFMHWLAVEWDAWGRGWSWVGYLTRSPPHCPYVSMSLSPSVVVVVHFPELVI